MLPALLSVGLAVGLAMPMEAGSLCHRWLGGSNRAPRSASMLNMPELLLPTSPCCSVDLAPPRRPQCYNVISN